MRLYLASDARAGRSPAWRDLLDGPRVALIENGRDGRRDSHLSCDFAAPGLVPEPLDLRAYFGDPQSLALRLAAFDGVWVADGNSFVLRRAMRQSGFDQVVRHLLARDALAYGGCGAGAAVAGSSLRGMELMDDPFELPPLYDEPLVWSGLGLTAFPIVPHFRSPHPAAAAAEKVVSYMTARRTRHRAIGDGEVIMRTGNLERLAS